MNRPFSRPALGILGSVLLFLGAGFLLPSIRMPGFGGEIVFDFQPALLGSVQGSLPQFGWGWSVLFPLPMQLEAQVLEPLSLGADPLVALVPAVLLVFFLGAGSLLWGLLFKSRSVAFWTLGVSFVSLLLAVFCVCLLFVTEGPRAANSQSEAVWALQKDFWRPFRPVRRFEIPGQELVMPLSPYYGGQIVCRDGVCRPERYRP